VARHTGRVRLASPEALAQLLLPFHPNARPRPDSVLAEEVGDLGSLSVVDMVTVEGDESFALALDQKTLNVVHVRYSMLPRLLAFGGQNARVRGQAGRTGSRDVPYPITGLGEAGKPGGAI
jgi:hypothetical protein